jgi:hypothetical protein
MTDINHTRISAIARNKPMDTNPHRLNMYICDTCGQHIVSKDVDEGTTPFMISCQSTTGCTGRMSSSFYRVFDPEGRMRWTHEWYRPSILRVDLPPAVQDHISKGGLLLRVRLDNPAANIAAATTFTHRHKVRGGKYRILFEGHFNYSMPKGADSQCPDLDREPVVIYESESGSKEVRLVSEFYDGRFEKLTPDFDARLGQMQLKSPTGRTGQPPETQQLKSVPPEGMDGPGSVE